MIRFSVLYPHRPDATFDFQYYVDRHAKLVGEKVGDALLSLTLDRGVSGLKSSSAPAYTAIATLTFRSMADVKERLYPHLAEISADIRNFTDIQPEILMSESVV